jgi:hypothetical protein
MDRPDQIDLLLGQFRAGMSLPSWLAALRDFVMVIILYRSEEEVSGIRAPWLVAVMQAAKAFWDRPDMKFVRDAMGREHVSGRRLGGERAVAGFERRGGPVPAGVRIGGPDCVTAEALEECAPWAGAKTRMAATEMAGAGWIAQGVRFREKWEVGASEALLQHLRNDTPSSRVLQAGFWEFGWYEARRSSDAGEPPDQRLDTWSHFVGEAPDLDPIRHTSPRESHSAMWPKADLPGRATRGLCRVAPSSQGIRKVFWG